MDFDFHTHRLDQPPGTGIVSLPQQLVLHPEAWDSFPSIYRFQEQGLYAAGVHPWWTAQTDFSLSAHLLGLHQLLQHPQVAQIGECGFDRLQGADLDTQWHVFAAQVEISEAMQRPMVLHVVRAFDVVLRARKTFRPQQAWTIHGFRGKPMLAQQLLEAGFDLSFGTHYNTEAYALTPPERRHRETDALMD